jgi:EmrB/QacA subfamily drug resistance transporter
MAEVIQAPPLESGSRRVGHTEIAYKYIVAAVFVVGMFMDILDTTIVNVALPTLGREFHAGTASVEWVVLGYVLSLAVWIPASGWIGDRVGTKKTFLFALAMFTVASALCGQATSLHQLIAFRLLQGVGGGLLVPVGTAMLFRAFPPEERARASAVLIIPTLLAPATGPVLGGLLVDKASWRWIFYVNLPIGIAALVFGALLLREHREPDSGRFDLWGFVLSGGGLASILYGLSQGPSRGWASTAVVVALVGGLGAFALLVVVELRARAPMLKLRLYGDRMFRNSNIASFFAYGSFLGVLFLLPLFLQNLRGLSAIESGLTTFPQAIGVLVFSQVAGRIYRRVGPRRMMVWGLFGAALVPLALTQVDLATSLWWIRILMFIRGGFMAFAFIPLQAATYATITPADTGRATALFSTNRQVAVSVGIASLATILTTFTARHLGHLAPTSVAGRSAQVAGFHYAFLAASVFALVGSASALLIRDEDAARTMQPHQGAAAPLPAAAA